MSWFAKLTDGLYPFEVVLLVLGVVLFIAILIAFLRNVFRDKPYGGLLVFFVIPIAMIGYSSIQSIQIGEGTVTIATKTAELVKSPDDQQLRVSLRTDVAKLSSRPISNAQTVATLAEAQFALGNDTEAQTNLQKAIKANPKLPAATQLQKKIQLTQNLNALTERAKSQPADTATKAELQNTITALQQVGVANPAAVKKMTEARMVLNH
jgi:tetratricopeptide (TPR) repeat protein